MSYDYMFFQSTHRLLSHEEIDEETTLPFGSSEEILSLLRQVDPDASVDAEGFGWLDPAQHLGSIHLSDDQFRVFHLAHIWPHEVQKLCTALSLTAFDGQQLKLIHPA